ncbi:MAG: tRNA dihydrouridine synthase DusB [Clostridia bacterium]|nr:tRNA dihydrouridine synthase DusB [Clostridia bacterium]
MKIKTIEIPHGLCLAPLAGVSDRAFRKICRAHGAEYLCSEMVSAAAICYGDKKTPRLCMFGQDEMPMGIQLFGSRPDFFAEAAKRIAAGTLAEGVPIPAAIDINMGCPVRKIVSNGEGSALMRDPALAAAIVRAVRAAVGLPVTVKIRAGFDQNHINAPEFAKALEDAGADMICIHGRTRAQMYGGRADLSVIAAVKAAVRVPVIGNGDLFSAADALRMLNETGCDGVMIARGAMGNPWIFEQIRAAQDGIVFTPPTRTEIVDEALRHLALLVETKPKAQAIPEARKHMAQYIRDFRGAAAARGAINCAESEEEMRRILVKLAAENAEESHGH